MAAILLGMSVTGQNHARQCPKCGWKGMLGEGVELHLVIVPARVKAVVVGDAIDAQEHRFAVDDERAVRFLSAASTISG